MTASNHVLTGSVFALATVTILPWWVILPAAFLLHFVLDSLPHYGQRGNPVAGLKRLRWILPIDATIGAAVLLTIFIARPEHWLLMLAAGVFCASPDLFSAPRFFRFLSTGDTARGKDWFSQFHGQIQWGERPWGAWVELAWFLAFGYILISNL